MTDDSGLVRHAMPLDIIAVRVARQTARLDEAVAFYRDRLGLPELGSFTDHDGYSGVLLGLPGTGAHLELVETDHIAPGTPHPESLLVLYLGDRDTVARVAADLPTAPAANPYWDDCGVTVVDPDGYCVVLAARSWP